MAESKLRKIIATGCVVGMTALGTATGYYLSPDRDSFTIDREIASAREHEKSHFESRHPYGTFVFDEKKAREHAYRFNRNFASIMGGFWGLILGVMLYEGITNKDRPYSGSGNSDSSGSGGGSGDEGRGMMTGIPH